MAEEQDNSGNISPVEQEAREQGWVPKEEFSGDEHKWVDAGEFLRRGELFQKIDHQNRKLKEMEKAFGALTAHSKQVEEAAYNRALKELRQQKIKALEEGDAVAAVTAEDQIDALKEQRAKQAERQEVDTSSPHPEFVAWTEQNSWYTSSGPMKAFADALGTELANSGKSPSEVLKEVSKRVREEFPHKFKNPNRERASNVESDGKGSGAVSKSSTKITLSDEEKRVMNVLVRSGALTEEEYMKDLAKIKERS